MLLRKLEIKNFRQFIGEQSLLFSVNNSKNVTIVMGENGSGKTSLAQSFVWCLYGETDFVDKIVLNKKIAGNMMPNTHEIVYVTVSLTHNNTDYSLTRRQNYKKDSVGKLSSEQPIFGISYKKNSQQEFLQYPENIFIRDEILPKELSKYFFFDGERIGNMSKEIQKGRSKEFGDAVRGLLGLNAFLTTIEHLKPTSKNGVIGSYNASLDSSHDSSISTLNEQIDGKQEEIDYHNERLSEIEKEIEILNEKINSLVLKIKENSDSEKLLDEKEQLKERIIKYEKLVINIKKEISEFFTIYSHSFFIRPMINNTIETLSNTGEIDKGIDDIKDTTIKFLIERKKCICGALIDFGNSAYENLHELLKYVPPQSIGTSIRHFVDESKIRLENGLNYFDEFSSKIKTLEEFSSEIVKAQEKKDQISKSLEGVTDTASLNRDLMDCENKINKLKDEERTRNISKGSLITERDTLKNELSKLALKSEKNRKIEIYKAYASYMYEYLCEEYKKNEDIVRNKLQNNINEIFGSIYQGGLSLNIDEKYRIKVIVDDFKDFNSDVETSTAQSISVIFAFISGIIKMARESKESSSDSKLLESEPYPLVMDAPLSSFDKRRIKTVCDALPKVAEQVIIFIKDTDGDIAEKNMGLQVGMRYFFDKKNEFETYIIERS